MPAEGGQSRNGADSRRLPLGGRRGRIAEVVRGSRLRTAEGGGQTTEDGGRMTDDGGRTDGGLAAKKRKRRKSRMAERRRTEDRGQMTDDG